MRQITEIIIHCSATRPKWMEEYSFAAQVAEIKRWHVEERGWSDIGYHYLISRQGKVVAGRPLKRDGVHVKGRNRGTIGICLIGGHGSTDRGKFLDEFTAAQEVALRQLLLDLRDRFGPVAITGHNQYAAKACPGFYVPHWLNQNPLASQPAKPFWLRLVNWLKSLF